MGTDNKPATGGDAPIEPPMDIEEGPHWMHWMLRAVGTKEAPGSADNPMIIGAAQYIGETFPSMQAYCDSYKHDETPWCGLAVAWAMARASIMPPLQFLSSAAWRTWGFDIKTPEFGCVICFEGHVGLCHRYDGSNTIYIAGGNQGDMVSIVPFDAHDIVACRWPKPEDYRTGYYPDDDRTGTDAG